MHSVLVRHCFNPFYSYKYELERKTEERKKDSDVLYLIKERNWKIPEEIKSIVIFVISHDSKQ